MRDGWEGGERGTSDRWVGWVCKQRVRRGRSNGVKIGHCGSACDTSGLNKSPAFVKPQRMFPKHDVFGVGGRFV